MRNIFLMLILSLIMTAGLFAQTKIPSINDPKVLQEIAKRQTPEEILDYVQKVYQGDFDSASYALKNARGINPKNTAVRDAEHYIFSRNAVMSEDNKARAGVLGTALSAGSWAYSGIKAVGETGVIRKAGIETLDIFVSRDRAESMWNKVADYAYSKHFHIDPKRNPTSKASMDEASWGTKGAVDGMAEKFGGKNWKDEKWLPEKPASNVSEGKIGNAPEGPSETVAEPSTSVSPDSTADSRPVEPKKSPPKKTSPGKTPKNSGQKSISVASDEDPDNVVIKDPEESKALGYNQSSNNPGESPDGQTGDSAVSSTSRGEGGESSVEQTSGGSETPSADPSVERPSPPSDETQSTPNEGSSGAGETPSTPEE